MAVYNLTQIANVTSILEFTQNVNTGLMNGLLGVFILISVGAVLIMGFHWSTRDIKGSIMATSFIIFVLSLLFKALDLIPNLALFACLMACAVAVAFTWTR